MSPVPPPQMTPAPYRQDDEHEPITGPHDAIATTGYVKSKLKLNEFQTVAGIVTVSVATAFSVFFMLEARAQTKVDAGVSRVALDLSKVDQRVDKLEAVTHTQALKTERVEVMVEMLVKNRGLRPPPPVSLDGGE